MRRGRFAPTPSGPMHIGNAFTALLAWLQMRQASGTFVLRIEDIDGPRSRPEYAQLIVEDLTWMGLDWDEGPAADGPYGPYLQSLRLELYEQAVDRLQRSGRLYPCYCSRAELAAIASAPHGLASEGAVYPGLCKALGEEERRRKAQAKPPSLRVAVPERPFSFKDGLAGMQHVPPGALGDFVVKRADGQFSYQLAVVVDDAAMGITDVLRGGDLLDSTPRQLVLYEMLGAVPPSFCHVPLLCGPEGGRLSKRDRSLSLAALRAAGVPPERLIGHLAYAAGLLDRPEPAKAAELIPLFSLERLSGERIALSEEALALG
ncbi:tRNA glutamyl-Q(34) synthetase GluQRS [Paenibacillus ehimensis]|uniref:Glutamyl-Q tRNA(Asp) synthetase n=1 Tax=Paenibacillus ehimensis TaxID=79264 RepID=A0ABT8VEM7_9BACL|nr:tRNA glutamyl-Q(34) synthetase GluQRS [Paenibacillus ehimensis]MDO3679425.1 tRNA glutamyl-Q(34) synthetase GluQRS [Paenibacillus ehimensis]